MSTSLPQDAGGGHVVSGGVDCMVQVFPPKPPASKVSLEVDHMGQMGFVWVNTPPSSP
jgi:hypothetical protein